MPQEKTHSLYSTIKTERALDDLRRGMPIFINISGVQYIIAAAESASDETTNIINQLTSDACTLLLKGKRLKALDIHCDPSLSYTLDYTKLTTNDTKTLCGINLDSNLDPAALPTIEPADQAAETIFKVIKLAELLPAAIVATAKKDSQPKELSLFEINAQDIEDYTNHTQTLTRLCKTNLKLANLPKDVTASIIAYRPQMGGREHYAIVIGNALEQDSPVIRVHSSCYTGDLLASLACDCRDQLHDAIALMGKEDGGIILYLLQEGRGIGLPNKLRAYALKETGLDTVEANENLGFDDDERLFAPAASILQDLNVQQVKLLSNNPRKAKGLQEYNIDVVETLPLIVECNEHNHDYLHTKATRLGHNMDNQQNDTEKPETSVQG